MSASPWTRSVWFDGSSTSVSALGRFLAVFTQRPFSRGFCRAWSIGSLRYALSLALALVLVQTLVEAAAAAPRFPSGLAQRWCGRERAADFSPGWFAQDRPQIKVVYAFASDRTGEFQQFSQLIQQDIKAALEKVGDESGGRRSIAFDLGTECGPRYVDIASVPLSLPSADYQAMKPTVDDRSAKIQAEVRTALGLRVGDSLGGGKRNFAVYVNIGPATKIEARARGDLPGCAKGGLDPSCQPDDRPGPENIANSGGYWAWFWGQVSAPLNRFAMLHEITHNLGAVQDSARHTSLRRDANGRVIERAHCTDGRDVMCRDIATEPFPCPEVAYDCGKDDYFNVAPPRGSYLATHWNVANSVFTCAYHSSPSERGCAPQGAKGDFNGDGRADLAVGVPGENVGTVEDAGAVNVLYGGASGIHSSVDQFWHQDQLGVRNVAEAGDEFGSALAAGDFNGDGFADLAVGVPGEDVGTVADAGAVNVLYGTASGLSSSADQFWRQPIFGADASEAGEEFGFALAADDYDGDGFADLAVGVPGEGVGTVEDAGAVNVIFGTASRLSSTGNQFRHQDRPGVEDDAEAGDRFGGALAAGDFSGDGFADLAVGVPSEDVGTVADAGAVSVLYGSISGVFDDQFWHQDSRDVLDNAGAFDGFGSTLAAGDFSGDGFADLAVGVPREDVEAVADAGAVNVLYATASGLSATGNQFWHQHSPDVLDNAEAGDGFGVALAAGDFSGDVRADLAVGVPGEDVEAVADGGAVNVLYATASGLSATGNQSWHQDSPDVQDFAEAGDGFGFALAAGDFNGGGGAHLAVGVRREDQAPPRPAENGGAANLLYSTGTTVGLEASSNKVWHQNSFLVLDVAEAGDEFGFALAP